jgi:hypothetical protein
MVGCRVREEFAGDLGRRRDDFETGALAFGLLQTTTMEAVSHFRTRASRASPQTGKALHSRVTAAVGAPVVAQRPRTMAAPAFCCPLPQNSTPTPTQLRRIDPRQKQAQKAGTSAPPTEYRDGIVGMGWVGACGGVWFTGARCGLGRRQYLALATAGSSRVCLNTRRVTVSCEVLRYCGRCATGCRGVSFIVGRNLSSPFSG